MQIGPKKVPELFHKTPRPDRDGEDADHRGLGEGEGRPGSALRGRREGHREGEGRHGGRGGRRDAREGGRGGGCRGCGRGDAHVRRRRGRP